ncbi:MAG TPA: hypothetical protein VF441_05780 [Acidimicrobiia bacterium]
MADVWRMHRFFGRVLVVGVVVGVVVLGTAGSAFADAAATPPDPAVVPSQAPTAITNPPVVALVASATPPASPGDQVGAASTPEVHANSVLPPIAVDPRPDPPQPPPAGSGPAGRSGSGFAATPDGTQAVLYGGGNVFGDGAALGDTWVWNGATWTPKCGTTSPGATDPCAPGPRNLVGEATGPTGVVLYGGQTTDGMGNTTPVGDSYLWNGTAWQPICNSCAPGMRAAPAMAGNGLIVLLFGGGAIGDNGPSTAFGDTWQFDGNAWNQVNAGGSGQPRARLGASMAWDGHQFVLFGGILPDNGSGNPTALADTWIWTGAEWVQACGDPLAPCGPAPRVLAGFSGLASPDPAQQGALLVGGLNFGGTNSPPSVLGDIWFWNGSAWIKQVSPWPDSTTPDIGPPTGVPLVGALAALPATCQVSLAADIITGRVEPDSVAPGATATPGTWNIGFDTNGDGVIDPCPVVPPTPPTPEDVVVPAAAAAGTGAEATATGTLPFTGSNPASETAIATGLAIAGLALIYASRRRTGRCTDQRAVTQSLKRPG